MKHSPTEQFQYRRGHLYAEGVALFKIAKQVGTPCYVYSRAQLTQNWQAFASAFADYPHEICYAVKACDNLAVLDLFVRWGAGFDIVSLGELHRCLAAGAPPQKIIFSGAGKQPHEIKSALAARVGCFNVESADELEQIIKVASAENPATIAVRLNPDVDANTHPYISTGQYENKFGVDAQTAMGIYKRAQASDNIRIAGVACHIGSQLTNLAPYENALQHVLDFVKELNSHGIEITHLDFGGGLGIKYTDENPPSISQYAAMLIKILRARKSKLLLQLEPGRALVGNTGVLLTRVNYLKSGRAINFCITDAGMNDLLRPALYQAEHEIISVDSNSPLPPKKYEVVGPVCESGDFLKHACNLNVRRGDLLAVKSVGAYGAVMASNYNSRARAAEVMVDGDEFFVIRAREKLEDLYRLDKMLPRD